MRKFLGLKVRPIGNGFILDVSFEDVDNTNPNDPFSTFEDIEIYCKNVAAVKRAVVQALAPVVA
jgi:hypothetical protein